MAAGPTWGMKLGDSSAVTNPIGELSDRMSLRSGNYILLDRVSGFLRQKSRFCSGTGVTLAALLASIRDGFLNGTS